MAGPIASGGRGATRRNQRSRRRRGVRPPLGASHGYSTGVWREHMLPRPDVHLAWYDAGSGPPVVFLHGGPGVDHVLLRPVAEPYAAAFRCVLYDQRGEGRSRLARVDAETCHVDRHVDDLEAVRAALGADRPRLVGHSWAAKRG